LMLYNLPRQGLFDKMNFKKGIANENQNQKAGKVIQFQKPPGFLAELQRLQLADNEKFLIDKYIEILARLQNSGITIAAHVSRQYHELYRFSKNKQYAGVLFYYNGKNKFTRIAKSGNITTDDALYNEVYQLLEKELTIIFPEENNITGVANKPEKKFDFKNLPVELSNLYHELRDALLPFQIVVEDIVHNKYMEAYTFVRNNERADIKFYYDEKHLFTTVLPDEGNCNSQKLLADIEKTIDQIKNNI
jgi:hydroxymethylpyrimidine pyrophosphatase-like HAD family hydrolase